MTTLLDRLRGRIYPTVDNKQEFETLHSKHQQCYRLLKCVCTLMEDVVKELDNIRDPRCAKYNIQVLKIVHSSFLKISKHVETEERPCTSRLDNQEQKHIITEYYLAGDVYLKCIQGMIFNINNTLSTLNNYVYLDQLIILLRKIVTSTQKYLIFVDVTDRNVDGY